MNPYKNIPFVFRLALKNECEQKVIYNRELAACLFTDKEYEGTHIARDNAKWYEEQLSLILEAMSL